MCLFYVLTGQLIIKFIPFLETIGKFTATIEMNIRQLFYDIKE